MRSYLGLVSAAAALTLSACVADNSAAPTGPAGVTLVAGSTLSAAMRSLEVLPGPARAKAKVYCNGSTCFAAAFDFTNDRDASGPLTVFTAYFQNLQGTYPPGGSSTPLSLDFFRFLFLGQDAPSDEYVDARNAALSFSSVGNVQAGDYNVLFSGSNIDPPWIFPNFEVWYGLPPNGVVGCNLLSLPPRFFSFQTCPSQGLDGWVKLDVVLRRLTGTPPGPTPIRPPVRFDDFLFTFGGSIWGTPALCTIGGKQPGTCTEMPYRSAISQ